MASDPAIRDHQAWLGYLQPDGLVVSPAALVDSQALLNRNVAPLQQRFLECVQEVEIRDQEVMVVRDPRAFVRGFLEWPDECLVGQDAQHPVPDALKIPLREFGETLEPSLAFRNPTPAEGDSEWMLFVQELPLGVDLDQPVESAMAGWAASHTRRFERLLREAQVPIGLLSNGSQFRLLFTRLALDTGCRAGEIANLRVADMDLDKGLGRIECTAEWKSKTRRNRPIAYTPATAARLRLWINKRPGATHVFKRPDDSSKAAYRRLRDAFKDAVDRS
ncbi:MAG: tyrosine-type recombinase/integrase, partial [Candidatus Brocadiia bacterium]